MHRVSHDLTGYHAGRFGRTMMRLKSGSHLYGTSTPQSDVDWRGVFMPSPESIMAADFHDVICSKPRHGKNAPDDVDETYISIHYFIRLCLDGETNAMDWLHAAPKQLEEFSEDWIDLISRRKMFYSRSLKGLVGYARHQAAKYGIRGSRLDAATKVRDALASLGDTKLDEAWDKLPQGEHIHIGVDLAGRRTYTVCGKQFQATAKASHYLDAMERFVQEYGHRAKLAKANEGIDWKAISHAFRAAYEFKRLLLENDYYFPLPEAPFLLSVKRGDLDYTSQIAPMLDDLMAEVEELSRNSTLSEKPDSGAARDWLVAAVNRTIR